MLWMFKFMAMGVDVMGGHQSPRLWVFMLWVAWLRRGTYIYHSLILRVAIKMVCQFQVSDCSPY